MREFYDLILAGKPKSSPLTMDVTDKFTGKVVSRVVRADRVMVDRAIAAAAEAAVPMRRMPAFMRQNILNHVAVRLSERHEEFAQVICTESGKPIKDARSEVSRAIDTFRIAAEESVRNLGEMLPLDISERAIGYEGVTKRIPIGPCSFITPFNFPLNLVAHKIAPAIAIGCPFVLKPAPQTPVTALLLGELLCETELANVAGSFSIVPCKVADAAPLVEDDRINLLSFTGSAAVGWSLKSKTGKKKAVLELGGNAACIVDEDAGVDAIVPRIIFGAFYQSGQSCISVQRLFVHQSIYEELKSRVITEARKLKAGDPHDETTFLGPLISEKDAARVERWVNEAVAAPGGAKLLCGGKRNGAFYEATIVENAPADSQLTCEEAFGPVITIESFEDFADACRRVNRSRYGLQAGVFTNSLQHAHHAFDELEVGGVIINDVPTLRIDAMPYGGIKDSGLGREGVRYAMQEMSELRLMVTKQT